MPADLIPEQSSPTTTFLLAQVLAASVVEDEVVKKTGLTPLNVEATQRLRAAYRTPAAQGRAERVMDAVVAITRGKGYTAGTKQLVGRVSGKTLRLQTALHDALADAAPRELNYVLCAVNVAAMVEVASRATVDMLVAERLKDLTTVARAALADGVQKLGMRYRPRRQAWVRDIMLGTAGLDLTHFKAYMDDGGDYHTMYKLMYNDLQGPAQAAVFAHLRAQGAAVRAALAERGPGGPPGAVLKVLSDIDDTVFSSGGSFPAGVDARLPRKCYYPGALALFAVLDRCFARRYAGHLAGLATGHPEMEEEEAAAAAAAAPAAAAPARPPSGRWARSPSPPAPRRRDAARGGVPLPFLSRVRTGAPLPEVPPGGSPPMRSLLGDLLTPRDEAAYPEGASPRATAWAEARAARPPLAHHQEGSNLVFLSARPESYKGFTESDSYRKYFQPLVARGDLDTSPTMLLGSLDSGARALFKLLLQQWAARGGAAPATTAAAALYQTLAAKKLSRFREYAAIYPEACFVFVGDNGQGDVLCAEILHSAALHGAAPRPSQLLATLVHAVAPPLATLSMLKAKRTTEAELAAAWRARRISLHRSHVGMAVQALRMGLLDAEALRTVAAAAAADLRRVLGRYSGRRAGRHLGVALRDLNGDLRAAAEAVPFLGVEPIEEEAAAAAVTGGAVDAGGAGELAESEDPGGASRAMSPSELSDSASLLAPLP